MEMYHAHQFKKRVIVVNNYVIFSFDDNTIHDRRMVELLNKYNFKGTFHINTGKLDKEGFITKLELSDLYIGHEVSIHTVNHPYLTKLSDKEIINEISKDKEVLIKLSKQEVIGMSYPFGDYDDRVIKLAKKCGIKYSRTVNDTFKSESIIKDYMKWNPTIHYSNSDFYQNDQIKDSMGIPSRNIMNSTDLNKDSLLFIWTHTWELGESIQKWYEIEELIKKLKNDNYISVTCREYYEKKTK